MNKLPDKIKKDMAMDRIGRKLCKFLEEYYAKEIIEFRVAMQSSNHFIIHPMNVDGKTLDVKWDFKNATYGNEVFGYTNKGNEFDESPSGEQGVQDERIKEEAIMFATWVENNGYIRFDKYYWTNDDCETRLSDEQLYHKYYLLIKK